ncbi:SAM-dependent methyltransferase [Nonomuraea sp. CA-143628]|uniref:SAM-dependent methyltransferase n=1 Tax=Nonomuraea sp. CA-143628 TaxID=3239997 RepID=UPI003D8FC922
MTTGDASQAPDSILVPFDPTRTSIAPVYDWIRAGTPGKDAFRVDRDAGDAVLKEAPWLREVLRENWLFLERAVDLLAALGIDQFVDVGAGMPTKPYLYEIARTKQPDMRWVAVDNDERVVINWRAAPGGDGVFTVAADVRLPLDLLEKVVKHIDLSKPTGFVFGALFHFVHDPKELYRIVATFKRVAAVGSYFVVTHATQQTGRDPAGAEAGAQRYREKVADITLREEAELEPLFGAGCQLTHGWGRTIDLLQPNSGGVWHDQEAPHALAAIAKMI